MNESVRPTCPICGRDYKNKATLAVHKSVTHRLKLTPTEVPDAGVPDPECREFLITFADGSREVWSGLSMFDAMDKAQQTLGKQAIRAKRHVRETIDVPVGVA